MRMNWILSNLKAAVAFFNAWMSQLYDVLMIDPISYQHGAIWKVVSKIYDALMGPAVSILIIGFYIALIYDNGEFIRTRRAGSIIWTYILLGISATILKGGKYILLLIFKCGRDILQIVTGVNGTNLLDLSWVEIPKAVIHATNNISLGSGIVFWVVTLIAALVIMICAFTVLMVVFGRLMNIYMHIAIAPLALACMAARPLRGTFAAYLKSFIGVCLQGALIVIVCMIFSAFASNFDFSYVDAGNQYELREDMTEEEVQQWFDENVDVGNAISGSNQKSKNAQVLWSYLAQMLFMYLLMASSIKASDQWIHQKLNL